LQIISIGLNRYRNIHCYCKQNYKCDWSVFFI